MINTILWDIDGTLLDFLIAEKISLIKTFEKFNLGECSDDDVNLYSKINIAYWEKLEKGEITKSQVLFQRFVDFFALKGMHLTDSEIEEFGKCYELGLTQTIIFLDNGYELIKKLSTEYKQYAVTNGAYNVQSEKLQKSGIMDIFDDAFISDSVGFEKPNVKFFEHVFEHINCCSKDEVLIVGDSLTSDMLGGNNAGIKCCWYNPKNKVNSKKINIDFEIKNLNELLDILNACN